MRIPSFVRFAFLISLTFTFSFSVLAQKPQISPGGVVNAADYAGPVVPSHGLAPGSIASIFGQNLASDTVTADKTPLPTSLAGTSVTVNGIVVPLFYVSPKQINFQVPSALPLASNGYAPLPVIVSTGAGSSDGVLADFSSYGPGIFALDSSGCGHGAVLNTATDGSVSVNSPENSASPGSYISIYATGLGLVYNAPPDGSPAPLDQLAPAFFQLSVGLAHSLLLTTFAGRAPGLVGVDQWNVRLPADAQEGCAVPAVVEDFAVSSQAVTIAVHRGGGQCVDPQPDSVGEITLTKTFASGTSSDGESDVFQASFPFSPGQPAPVLPQNDQRSIYGVSTASAPACPIPGYGSESAGSLRLDGPGGSFLIAPMSDGDKVSYQRTLPIGTLQPGAYTVSSAGSSGVRPFESVIQLGSDIQISGSYPPGTSISDHGSFQVSWAGGDDDEIVKVTLISHLFQFDTIHSQMVPATAHSIALQGPNGFLGLQASNNAELVFEVLPKQAATFSASGLALGGYLNWEYKHRFAGLAIQ